MRISDWSSDVCSSDLRDRVELLADAAGLLDLLDHHLAEILEMNVAGHELSERVGDRDDRLLEVAIVHAGGAPERTGARHVATGGTGAGTIRSEERGEGDECVSRGRYRGSPGN